MSQSAMALLLCGLVQGLLGGLASPLAVQLGCWLTAALTLGVAGAVQLRADREARPMTLVICWSGAIAMLLGITLGPWVGLIAACLAPVAGCLWNENTSPEPQQAPQQATIETADPVAHKSNRQLLVLKELEEVGILLTGSTTSLAATARQQEASIAEQAAAATQILATSQEINATSRELVSTMNDVAANSANTSKVASVGHELLLEMQSKMDRVLDAASNIASKLSNLNERAHRIGRIAITIAKVADQTNLLSLNAAIEAEKAGEGGRGLGIVAVEIQRLADQTAVATLDIEHMIREMLTAVSSSVMGMEKFTEDVRQSAETAHSVVDSLGQIILQVQTMDEHFEQVNNGMHGQAQGAEQITDSMLQLSEATHQTANSIKHFNAAIATIKQATEQVAQAVVRGRADEESLDS